MRGLKDVLAIMGVFYLFVAAIGHFSPTDCECNKQRQEPPITGSCKP